MKKVLIISYYWPPSGGPGVQRVLKFAKHLPEFGWQPIILTVKNGNFPSIDETLANEIPKECKVYKTDIFEPLNFYKTLTGNKNSNIPTFVLSKSSKESIAEKLSRWIRANLFIPDAKIGWAHYIVREGLKIISSEKPDLIFSSSPPHSLQIGAMRLAKKAGIPWVADFRDPWTDAFWQKDISRIFLSKLIDARFERLAFKSADKLVTVSQTIAKNISTSSKSPAFIIPNGFDAQDFHFSKISGEYFSIVYTGTLGKDQSVIPLINTLNLLSEELLSQIKIHFYGSFHERVIDEINSSPFRELFFINKSVTHEDSIKAMMNADSLLLIIPNVENNKGILTGKLFEYIATGNPIICFGPKDGDAAEIIFETNCGKTFDYKESASGFIAELVDSKKDNRRFTADENRISKYSRKNLTKELSDIFNELT